MKNNKLIWIIPAVIVALLLVALILSQTVFAPKKVEDQASSGGTGAQAEPFMLMIPRWFLSSLTLDGQAVTLPEKQMSLQFDDNGKAGGEAACNSFGTTYHAESGGSLYFDQITSTMMACDAGMDQEASYLRALSRVKRFSFDGGNLVLSSEDGKTTLVFRKPPK